MIITTVAVYGKFGIGKSSCVKEEILTLLNDYDSAGSESAGAIRRRIANVIRNH